MSGAVAAGVDAATASAALRFIAPLLPPAFTASADTALDRAARGTGRLERHRHIGVLLAGLTLLGVLSRAFRTLAKGKVLQAVADADAIDAALLGSGVAALAADFAAAEITRLAAETVGEGTDPDAASGPAAASFVLPAVAALLLTALRDGLAARPVHRPPPPAA